eukprot:42481-Hanusia_phi.AAC.5
MWNSSDALPQQSDLFRDALPEHKPTANTSKTSGFHHSCLDQCDRMKTDDEGTDGWIVQPVVSVSDPSYETKHICCKQTARKLGSLSPAAGDDGLVKKALQHEDASSESLVAAETRSWRTRKEDQRADSPTGIDNRNPQRAFNRSNLQDTWETLPECLSRCSTSLTKFRASLEDVVRRREARVSLLSDERSVSAPDVLQLDALRVIGTRGDE